MATPQLYSRTAAQFTAANKTPGHNELWVERDTGKIKRGDGLTAWNDLAYWPPMGNVSRATPDIATGAIPGATVDEALDNTRYGIVGAAGVLNATNTFANITGLTWSIVASGVYVLEAYLWATAEATTVGVQYGINGPTIGAGTIRFGAAVPTTVTAVEFISGAAYQAAQTTTATPSTTVPALTIAAGAVTNGATAGTLAIQFRSEDTNDAIIAGGSWARLTRIA
jgi:hypothetical protein